MKWNSKIATLFSSECHWLGSMWDDEWINEQFWACCLDPTTSRFPSLQMKAAKLPELPTRSFTFEADHSYGAWKRKGNSTAMKRLAEVSRKVLRVGRWHPKRQNSLIKMVWGKSELLWTLSNVLKFLWSFVSQPKLWALPSAHGY